jgi:hypothetical protein
MTNFTVQSVLSITDFTVQIFFSIKPQFSSKLKFNNVFFSSNPFYNKKMNSSKLPFNKAAAQFKILHQ